MPADGSRPRAGTKGLVSSPLVPISAKKESNEENTLAFCRGELKHKPPTFEFIADQCIRETAPVYIKEVKLPECEQTHEVCYEPLTQCVFVSQMTSCLLVRIPIDEDGFVHDDHDAWKVGKRDGNDNGIEGIHNISLSKKHPGCLWISLQYSNQLLLVDVTKERTLSVKQIYQVPTVFTDPENGKQFYVGGPHCMRECPVTGDVWAGLKGALHDAICSKSRSPCCDPVRLEASMKELKELHGFETPIPDGWAVWRVTPSEYDPQAEDGAKGGTLYKCRKSPSMLDFDDRGNCYVPQDASDTMLVIDRKSGACKQLEAPWPFTPTGSHTTGPAVGRAPNGSIWISQLGSYNALVRIDPSQNDTRVLYEFGGPPWCKTIHLIHLAFSPKDEHDKYNRIYALSSDLLDHEALNAVVILNFDDSWTKCLARRVIPLPTQDCACHRIAFIDTAQGTCEESRLEGRAEIGSRSIVITELATSKLLQIKVRNLRELTSLDEFIYHHNGFEVRKYRATNGREQKEQQKFWTLLASDVLKFKKTIASDRLSGQGCEEAAKKVVTPLPKFEMIDPNTNISLSQQLLQKLATQLAREEEEDQKFRMTIASDRLSGEGLEEAATKVVTPLPQFEMIDPNTNISLSQQLHKKVVTRLQKFWLDKGVDQEEFQRLTTNLETMIDQEVYREKEREQSRS